MNFSRSRKPAGLILLVVLSMLAFLGVLVIAYVSFSSKSQRTSFSLASREFHAPPVDDLFEEALMKLVRGTNDPSDPFYGEDLLTDLYGRKDLLNAPVMRPMLLRNPVDSSLVPERRPVHVGGGFVRFPVNLDGMTDFVDNSVTRPNWTRLDDAFTGRVITFRNGPLAMKSFRVLRSTGVHDGTTASIINVDSFFIELDPSLVVTLGNGETVAIDQLTSSTDPHAVAALFYSPGGDGSYGTAVDDDGDGNPSNYGEAGYPVDGPSPGPTDDQPYRFVINPAPQNSPGIGLEATGRLTATRNVAGVGVNLPVSFFPNVSDGTKGTVGGDYDEAYDAPDYFNWFLAGRVRVPSAGGLFQDRIIPSFHRPSVLNYLVNTRDWSNSPTTDEVRGVVQALSRATFRPLPFVDQYANPPAVNPHPGFTGGSADFALSTPFSLPQPGGQATEPLIARLDRFFDALIRGGGYPPGDPRNGNPWDVDNDGDGVPDSIWVNIGLPLITSPEGKLLQPLIAPMIEDTGGKLNVNAHGNYAQVDSTYQTNPLQGWAGSPPQNRQASVFRGLGFGPAEIALPSRGVTGNVNLDGSAISNTNSELLSLLRQRSRWGSRPEPAVANGNPVPGTYGNDALDALRTAERRRTHTAAGGVGFSSDPFGRGGVGVGRTGQLLASVSGTELQTQNLPQGVRTIDESINDPYEFDPTGELDGDSAFLFDELEAVLRDNSWDNDLLPTRLRNLLRNSLNDKAELARMLTTLSTSYDHPNAVMHTGADNRQDFYSDPANLGPAQLAQVLFSRLDLTGTPEERNTKYKSVIAPELRLNRKIDVNRPFGNGVDDAPRNGVIDEPSEYGITEAFGRQTDWDVDSRPNQFRGVTPDYGFGSGVDPRQLLARHLYVLMMALMAELDTTGDREPHPLPLLTSLVNGDVIPDDWAGTPEEYKQQYTARRIAQWAVNVVDYRDPDSIMTPFFYDPNPLDGWDVDPNNPNFQFLVWGVEAPELLLSESLAFHDVRVRDTERDNNTQKKTDDATDPDPNTDQVRIPQGSLFLELYCPRAPVSRDQGNDRDQAFKAGFPREFYRYPTEANLVDINNAEPDPTRPDRLQLDLALEAPDGVPVWRIAISAPHFDPGSLAGADFHPNFEPTTNPWLLRAALPNSASFEPNRPDELIAPMAANGLVDSVEIDRYIVFRNFGSVANLRTVTDRVPDMEPDQVFFAPNGYTANQSRRLFPGQFLAISPREVTHVGSQVYDEAIGDAPSGPSPQRFSVELLGGDSTTGSVTHYHTTGPNVRLTPPLGSAHPAPFAPAKPLVIGTFPPQGAGGGWGPVYGSNFVGLNVSEPMPNFFDAGPNQVVVNPDYYPQPTERYAGAVPEYPLQDAYVNMDPVEIDNTARDLPLDPQRNPRLPRSQDQMGNPTEPYLGAIPQYCTAYLQRLANPLIPFHPITNPYRTIDALPIDLNVFSGEERDTTIMDDAQYARRSRQRNGQKFAPGDLAQLVSRDVLFSYETNGPEIAPVDQTSNTYFAFTGDPNFYSSLSFLNTNYVAAANRPTNRGFDGFSSSIGMDPNSTGVEGFERSQPQTAFSLHPWLNRDFANHFELMMVPATSAGRLFEEFTVAKADPDPDVEPRYADRSRDVVQPMNFPTAAPTSVRIDDSNIAEFQGPHRHLLNFFQGSELEDEAIQFGRIFDYITTLPRFRGEVELINPSRIAAPTGTPPPAVIAGSAFFRNAFQPPFNFLHDGRRQGQINLNTLSDYPVWIGLMHGHLVQSELSSQEGDIGQEIAFQDFQRSRRGYPVSAPPPLPAPSQRRIFYAGNVQPRTGQWYNYAPEMLDGHFPTQYAGMFRNIADADLAPVLPEIDGQPPKLARAGVVNSLLRQDVEADAAWDLDLPATPFFVRENLNETHRDVDRNPFAHYQTLMRMPNLVTNNSQVFIVRVTMGFFEVDPNSAGSLGREYKEEIAENERYQMLYLIDRSKPVGFIPGEDLNARDVVVYERRLQ